MPSFFIGFLLGAIVGIFSLIILALWYDSKEKNKEE